MLLKRVTEETAAEVVETFLTFFAEEGQKHFEIEEQVLLPEYAKWVGLEELTDPIITQMLREHVELRSLVEQLRDGAGTALIRETGQRLDAHVRLEERTVFPKIQQRLTEEQLSELATRVDQAERS